MITELLLSCIFGIADFLLGLLPAFEWSADTSVWEYLKSFISMVAYLLPWNHIMAIFDLLIGLVLLRITIAGIRFILGLIPFVG